jgi:hypothetical protein
MKTPEIQKQKSKLFVLTIQDENGSILRIMNNVSYETLWLTGTTESKAMRGYWTIFDLEGRAIDGNFKVRVTK